LVYLCLCRPDLNPLVCPAWARARAQEAEAMQEQAAVAVSLQHVGGLQTAHTRSY
jgi:hypothetical protein